MAKTKTERETLNEVYLTVVREWAVYAGEIAENLGLNAKQIGNYLRKLSRAGLVVGEHVNGERQVMWQSYFNTQDYDTDTEIAKAQQEFDEAFPNDPGTKKAHGKGGGARYTPDQIAKGLKLTVEGGTAKEVAAAVGVKSPNYFRKVVKAEIERVAVENAKRGRKSARVAKRVVKRVAAMDPSDPSQVSAKSVAARRKIRKGA